MTMIIYACVIYTDQVNLNSLVQEKSFMIRIVPRDGNYLFSAVTVQLDKLGIQPSKTTLREQLVKYLQTHPYAHDGFPHLREYISPALSSHPSNADTVAPSEQDDFMNATEDPQLHQQLTVDGYSYLERVNAGAWGII